MSFASYPSLNNRAVLITGGATGIGAALVEHFAAQGARVGFIDLAEAEGISLADRLATAGHPRPAFRHADLCDIAALRAAIASIAAETGDPTVLVNNAAHDERHAIADVTPEYWDGRLAVNLRHQFFAVQAVVPGMRAGGGGSIINMGSLSWRVGQGGMPAYTASKAAVEGMSRGLARDLGPDKIRVNTLVPGWIMTERQRALWLTPEAEARLMQDQALKERLYPADIARMALWLAADDSRMCTGQAWVVDGGWL
ncbi:SDR family NAD(P)-dependent oxidoreductase [Acidisphaera sp. L21]|uniref:SDR family NAD(P)-dependent oxidoreductase n=1 Tax=Acidisphaera sp. L21 TaxID=1641851 RepID=UPI00131BA82A|nr:SDR family oxidoreductase [Acidisphaera sp. L21]